MHFLTILPLILALLSIHTDAAVASAQHNEIFHDRDAAQGDVPTDLQRRSQYEAVSSSPEPIAARSDHGGMSGNHGWNAVLVGKDGFIRLRSSSRLASSPKDAPNEISERSLGPGSSPLKKNSWIAKLIRRLDALSNPFVGNLLNKWTQTSPTKDAASGGINSYQQNGASSYGTLDMKNLPKYYGGYSSTPWGLINTTNSNPYKSCPNNGTTRYYDFTLAECDIRPDGVETKGAVCINGQFPGPLIEANYGDTIHVKVTNNLPHEGTSMHWHGFLQTGMNEMDGVPGVTQCPIAPGASMTYNFRAELYGTAWYHTHYGAQYAGGRLDRCKLFDIDIGPIMLSDWYRNDYMTNIRGLMRPVAEGGPINPLTNSNLINGKMRFPCDKTTLSCNRAGYSFFRFTSGKSHLLRLVNTGSNAVQKFAIDGHEMEVIANDFMPVEPYNVSMIALGVGQRADVIVHGIGKPEDKYWLRSNIAGCSVNDGLLTEALGVIYYERANTKILPTAAPNQGPAADPHPRFCGNSPLLTTVPAFPLKASPPAITKRLDINMKNNGTHMLLHFGDNSFRANFNEPLLRSALKGENDRYDPARNVWNLDSARTMRAIIHNYDPAPHPIHLHGHNMQILSSGFGEVDENNITIARPENPQRRDVQIMPPGTDARPSNLVIQWDADNPGVWPLHCHFSWHSSLGLAINVLETPDDIPGIMGQTASGPVAETCNGWDAFTRDNVLHTGIDSGM